MPREDTQFKPGHDRPGPGAPRGPRGKRIATRLHEILDGDGKLLDAIAKVLIKEALGGDSRFMAMLLDRVDGRVASDDEPEPEVADFAEAVGQSEADAAGYREPDDDADADDA